MILQWLHSEVSFLPTQENISLLIISLMARINRDNVSETIWYRIVIMTNIWRKKWNRILNKFFFFPPVSNLNFFQWVWLCCHIFPKFPKISSEHTKQLYFYEPLPHNFNLVTQLPIFPIFKWFNHKIETLWQNKKL